jgi:FG-GAP-like repeat
MKYFTLLFFISLGILACSTNTNPSEKTPKPTNKSGQALSELYCASCHLKPEPALLDKTTWEKEVLPEMSYYVGVKPVTEKFFRMNPDEIAAAVASNLYPNAPLLAESDWLKVVDYYTTNAPEKPLPQADKAPVKIGLPFFDIATIPSVGRSCMISMLKIDTLNHQLYVSRRERSLLEIYDKSLKKHDSIRIESPISAMILTCPDKSGRGSEKYALQMGVMDPNDLAKGHLSKLDNQRQWTKQIDSLQRPVHLNIADLNQDGIEDRLICNYGNRLGNLTWYDGKTQKHHILSRSAGARRTIVHDMNNDGKPDIIALFAQAREHISIFYNQGQGDFEEETVLTFPPVYGSSYIDLVDMNKDGKLDILYTNGDNADYSMVLKNYHGVRIFTNDGKNQFKETYFYPINGASQVTARDFDHDGDIDLATIAFFQDESKPNESFIFFENKGNNVFSLSTFANTTQGKWLVMDVADLDGDGREDIVLGSFFRMGKLPDKPLAIVYLKNKS